MSRFESGGEYTGSSVEDERKSSAKTIKSRFGLPKGWNTELYHKFIAMRDDDDAREFEREIDALHTEGVEIDDLSSREIWEKKKIFFDTMAAEYEAVISELDALRVELNNLDSLPVVQELKKINSAADLERSEADFDLPSFSKSEHNLRTSIDAIKTDKENCSRQLIALETAKPGFVTQLFRRKKLEEWRAEHASLTHKIAGLHRLLDEKNKDLQNIQTSIKAVQERIKEIRADQTRQENDVRSKPNFTDYKKRYEDLEDKIAQRKREVFGEEHEEDYIGFINTAEWLQKHFDMDQPRWFDAISPPHFQSTDREESVREILQRMIAKKI